jgi:dihydrofolate reductase
MAGLNYAAFTSLDGYVTDESGDFDWAELDEEVLTFVNDRESRIGTYLFGRRMYETMSVWEAPEVIPGQTAAMMEFAQIWRAAEKIVYSTTLATVAAPKTRLERTFDADAVRALKAAATRDLGLGGAELAAHAIRAGLVDEYHLLIAPIIAGGGTPYVPSGVAVKLELVDEHTFTNGLVHLRYRAKT